MSQMPPPQQQPPHPHQAPPPPYGQPHLPAPGIAITAMVLGILAIITSPLLIFGVVAIILGLIAVNQTGGATGRQGRGFAIAGVAMGAASLLLGVVVAIGIMLPALGAARRTAKRMQNSTQLRGLHQGMFTYANSNKENFPGLNARGEILLNSTSATGDSGDGDTVEARYWILLTGNFFTPEYTISPSETDVITPYASGPVASSNYSYAYLSIQGQPERAPAAGGRASEWTQSSNTQAVVASDRNTGSNASTGIQSIHTSRPGEWKGSVLWNDNHVAFEQTHILETRYGNGSLNVDFSQAPNDNLFDPAGDADAWMIYSGD